MRQKDSGIVRSRQGKSVFEGTVRGFRKVGSDENPGERDARVRGRPRLDLLVDLMFLNHCCPLVADARARPGETMCLRTQIPVMPSTRQRAQTGPVQIGERFRGGVQAACIRLRSSYFGRVKGRRISTTLRLMLAMARPGSISTGSAIVRKTIPSYERTAPGLVLCDGSVFPQWSFAEARSRLRHCPARSEQHQSRPRANHRNCSD